MIRVAHVNTFLSGGAGKAAYRLHEALNLSGEAISYFVYADQKPGTDGNLIAVSPRKRGIAERLLIKLGIYENPYLVNDKYLKKLGKAEYEVISFPETVYEVERESIFDQVDIIHLHWVGGGFLNYSSFFTNIKKPIIWTLHDMNPFMGIYHYEGDKERNTEEYRILDELISSKKREILKNVSNIQVVCLSEWMYYKSLNSEILGHFNHTIIPNGINLSQYKIEIPDKNPFKAGIGIDNDLVTLLIVADGVSNPRKGFDLLVEALGKITYKINLIKIGNGYLNMPAHVNYIDLGFVESDVFISKIYSIADLLILPSREDNLPNVMLEAFAAGLPVMAFNTGGMSSYVKDGINGVLINSMTSSSLAEGLTLFIKGEIIFDRKQVRSTAVKNFSIERQVQNFLSLYKSKVGLS